MSERIKKIDIEHEIDSRFNTSEKRSDFDAGLCALRFGLQICARREELGYKQKDMKQFGINTETMCRIEKGERLPDPKTQSRLTIALQARIIIEPSGEWRLEAVSALQNAA